VTGLGRLFDFGGIVEPGCNGDGLTGLQLDGRRDSLFRGVQAHDNAWFWRCCAVVEAGWIVDKTDIDRVLGDFVEANRPRLAGNGFGLQGLKLRVFLYEVWRIPEGDVDLIGLAYLARPVVGYGDDEAGIGRGRYGPVSEHQSCRQKSTAIERRGGSSFHGEGTALRLPIVFWAD
jgi:hypothetical protein